MRENTLEDPMSSRLFTGKKPRPVALLAERAQESKIRRMRDGHARICPNSKLNSLYSSILLEKVTPDIASVRYLS